jgi:O-antigen ligase
VPGDTGAQGLKVWNAISADPFETRLSVLKLLALTLAGVLLLRYTRSERRLRTLIYTIIFVGVLSAIFGILRQTTQHSPGFFLPFLKPNAGFGQFINKNHFAYLMEMALGLTLGLIVARGVRREHVLIYLALALPLWTALVLSNSRGGILSMLALIFFLAILFSFFGIKRRETERVEDRSLLQLLARTKTFRTLLIICLVITVFLGAIWTGGEDLTSRLETVSSEIANEGGVSLGGAGRKDIWKATWKMIKDHPLTGVGFNGYWAAIPSYHQASGELTPQQAHNDYLELLASGGIIGVLFVLWFLFLFFKTAGRSFRSKNSFGRAASVAACAALFAVAIHSTVDFGLHITVNALIFTALIVIASVGGAMSEERSARA